MLSTRAFRGLILLLAAGLFIFSVWMPNMFVTPMRSLVRPDNSGQPDFTIEGFTTTAMDTSGQPKYRLAANRLTHFQDGRPSRLVAPHLVQFTAGESPVHTHAGSGEVSADGKLIVFEGDVRVEREQTGGSPRVELTAHSLRVILP